MRARATLGLAVAAATSVLATPASASSLLTAAVERRNSDHRSPYDPSAAFWKADSRGSSISDKYRILGLKLALTPYAICALEQR